MAKNKKAPHRPTYELSLDEFLKVLEIPFAEKFFYPVNRFPTEKHLDDFLSNIHERSEEQIINVLRHFVPKSVTYGMDNFKKSILKQWEGMFPDNKSLVEQAQTNQRHIKNTEYYRRLVSAKTYKDNVWEGMTWTLDLLPHFPDEAIKALSAYSLANCQFLPDDSLHAIRDCYSIIRARYINKEQPREVFLGLSPTEFEKLVASVYRELGYAVSLTKSSHDSGVDIYAERNLPSLKEKTIIQCKRYTSKVSVDEIRKLLGVVSSKKATKGVLVTSSDFTSAAIRFADENPNIELINHKQLSSLINKKHGPYWSYKIDRYLNRLI